MIIEKPLPDLLVAVFEDLKNLDAHVSSLQLKQETLQETLDEMDPQVFLGALERVQERRKRNAELVRATSPFVRNASGEYAEIIRRLRDGEDL